MHEYPVAKRIIRIAEEAAKSHGAARVKRINIVAGELSGFIGESIKMYFDMLSRGSAAQGAEINVKTVRPTLKCSACGMTFDMKSGFSCPSCGGDARLTGAGREFYVESIDIETEDRA
jgi:hydrogenase nickel incorporation protein HypA/HybF